MVWVILHLVAFGLVEIARTKLINNDLTNDIAVFREYASVTEYQKFLWKSPSVHCMLSIVHLSTNHVFCLLKVVAVV